MTHFSFRAATAAVLLTAVSVGSAQAQNNAPGAPAPFPADRVSAQSLNGQYRRNPAYDQNLRFAAQADGVAAPVAAAPTPTFATVAPGYPYLNAPLYSSPRQDIPYQVGGTVITNQALSPHEMLYAHEYKAMYPPFYYRAHGGWIVTPFGVRSHEHWKLQGTVVKVKYHSHIGCCTGFHPPKIR